MENGTIPSNHKKTVKNQLINGRDLRSRLSGIACPTYVVDVPGHGKIPIPLGYWGNIDLSQCKDFKGQGIFL